jgi:uncharacterized protein with PIN domain
MGKCPHCQQPVNTVTAEYVSVTVPSGKRTFHGTSFSCPHCQAIFSVGIDHIAAAQDLQNGLVDRLVVLLRRSGS